MRRFSVSAGSLLGIELRLHVTWFLVLGLVIVVTTGAYGDAFPELPIAERVAMGTVTGLALFGCLVCHEIAHALVARRFGIGVQGITLFLLGGVAEIRGEPGTPSTEFAMALAGPAASVAIASLAALLGLGADAAGWKGISGVLLTLAVVNLGVAVFNLVPGLPLDGGRLLRAAIWRFTGSFTRATKVAAGTGQVVALALAALGLALILMGRPEGGWYLIMGLFVFSLARRARATPPPVPPAPPGALALIPDEGQAAQPGP